MEKMDEKNRQTAAIILVDLNPEHLQWRPFENQQSPVYVVKWLFSRRNNMR